MSGHLSSDQIAAVVLDNLGEPCDLSADQSAALSQGRRHIAACKECRAACEDLRRSLAECGKSVRLAAASHSHSGVWARVKARLRGGRD